MVGRCKMSLVRFRHFARMAPMPRIAISAAISGARSAESEWARPDRTLCAPPGTKSSSEGREKQAGEL